MSLFDGHQIVHINASVFNPVKRRVTVAEMQTINRILPLTGKAFFILVFPGVRITGKVRDLTCVLYAGFLRKIPRKTVCCILDQDRECHALNSAKCPSRILRSASSKSRRRFSFTTISLITVSNVWPGFRSSYTDSHVLGHTGILFVARS
jgi:hypothetical protein